MSRKHQVHNLIILDESGSMESIKESIISGFNEIVQTIKGIQLNYPEQEHFISMVTFNDLETKTIHFNEPVNLLQEIDGKRYKPNAGTPLFDAMGFSMVKMKNLLAEQKDYNVLVTILTDGEENASKEYNHKSIKALVDDLKQNGWTFTYIGTDHEVENFAASISITNHMRFTKDKDEMNEMFQKESNARHRYSDKIRSKQSLTDDFYDDSKLDEDPKDKK